MNTTNEPLTEDKIQHVDYTELFNERPEHIATTRVVRLVEITSAVQGLKEDIDNYQEKSIFYDGQRSMTKTRALMLIDKWFPFLLTKTEKNINKKKIVNMNVNNHATVKKTKKC